MSKCPLFGNPTKRTDGNWETASTAPDLVSDGWRGGVIGFCSLNVSRGRAATKTLFTAVSETQTSGFSFFGSSALTLQTNLLNASVGVHRISKDKYPLAFPVCGGIWLPFEPSRARRGNRWQIAQWVALGSLNWPPYRKTTGCSDTLLYFQLCPLSSVCLNAAHASVGDLLQSG